MRALTRIGLTVGAVALLPVAGCGGEPPAPRLDDPEFAQQAGKICARGLPPLRADLSDDEARQPEDIAPTVEARADSLDALVEKLRAVEVHPSAQDEVAAWLDDWDTYVEVGRRYAKALREGDPERYAAVADEGLAPQARISAFARANDFESCALDGVPLPPREGL